MRRHQRQIPAGFEDPNLALLQYSHFLQFQAAKKREREQQEKIYRQQQVWFNSNFGITVSRKSTSQSNLFALFREAFIPILNSLIKISQCQQQHEQQLLMQQQHHQEQQPLYDWAQPHQQVHSGATIVQHSQFAQQHEHHLHDDNTVRLLFLL